MRAALKCLKASPHALKSSNPERPLVTPPGLTSPTPTPSPTHPHPFPLPGQITALGHGRLRRRPRRARPYGRTRGRLQEAKLGALAAPKNAATTSPVQRSRLTKLTQILTPRKAASKQGTRPDTWPFFSLSVGA